MKMFTIYGNIMYYPKNFKVTEGISLNFESNLGRFLKIGRQSIFIDYVNPPVLSNDKKTIYFSEINLTKTTKKMLFSFPEEAFKDSESTALILWKLKISEEKRLKLTPVGGTKILNVSTFNIGENSYMGALTSIPEGSMIVSTPVVNEFENVDIPPSIVKYEEGFIRIRKINTTKEEK